MPPGLCQQSTVLQSGSKGAFGVKKKYKKSYYLAFNLILNNSSVLYTHIIYCIIFPFLALCVLRKDRELSKFTIFVPGWGNSKKKIQSLKLGIQAKKSKFQPSGDSS